MFVTIGIGLAAGAQLLIVAFVASVLFNALILALARTGYASEPRQLSGWTLTVAAPAAAQRRSVVVRVDVAEPSRAEPRLGAVLGLCAKQWEKAGAAPLPDGRVRLEYRATLKKKSSPDALRAALQSIDERELGNVAVTADG